MKKPTGKQVGSAALDALLLTLGVMAYALGVVCFTAPNDVAPGGVTGLATAVNHLTGLPIGAIVWGLNIPLLAAAFFFLGKEYVLKTLYCVFLFGFFVDFLFVSLPALSDDRLLSCLYGGALIGLGLGLTYLRQGSTGGTDIVVFLLRRWFPHVRMGTMVLAIDAVIVAVIALLYGSIDAALYAALTVAVSAKAIDLVLYGAEAGKLIFVVSPRSKDIAQEVTRTMGRGVTLLDSRGGYTGNPSEMLLCAVRTPEFARFKKLVRRLDPCAFIMVTNTAEILGKGFKENR